MCGSTEVVSLSARRSQHLLPEGNTKTAGPPPSLDGCTRRSDGDALDMPGKGNTTMITDPGALTALQSCHSDLHCARAAALSAAGHLGGARASRTLELAEILADCIAGCHRLCFVVEGDLRYEGQR